MITTERLLIRRVRPDDAQDLFDIYGDAETMRYWDSAPDPDLAASQSRANRLANLPEPLTYFAIAHQDKLIGTGGVHARNEIGYILNRTYWRQGFMREALSGLLPYLFRTLHTDELTAEIDPRNAASEAFLTSLGFRKTGAAKHTICLNGEWCDSAYFALQRPS